MLPETMSIIQLEEAIENHDCHLSPEDSCDCVWLKQVLQKKKLLTNREPFQPQKDPLHYT